MRTFGLLGNLCMLGLAALAPTAAQAIEPLSASIGGVSRIEERCGSGYRLSVSIDWSAATRQGAPPSVRSVDLQLDEQPVLQADEVKSVVDVLNRWTAAGYVIKHASVLCPVADSGPFVVRFIVDARNDPFSFKEVVSLRISGTDAIKPVMLVRRKIADRWETVAAETADVTAPAGK